MQSRDFYVKKYKACRHAFDVNPRFAQYASFGYLLREWEMNSLRETPPKACTGRDRQIAGEWGVRQPR